MNEISAMDLKGFVSNTVYEVFDTMLSMEVQLSDTDSRTTVDGDRIMGSVGFAGELTGNLCIHVSDTFARLMTAAMLGMELEEIEGEEEVHDVIGEMSNMIGGNLKSAFCDAGFPCNISIPYITSGSDFKTESMNWVRHECLVFLYQQHLALIEVFIK